MALHVRFQLLLFSFPFPAKSATSHNQSVNTHQHECQWVVPLALENREKVFKKVNLQFSITVGCLSPIGFLLQVL